MGKIRGDVEVFGLALWGGHILAILAKRDVTEAAAEKPSRIDASMSPAKVLDWFPETLEVFVAHGFGELRNPILRATLALDPLDWWARHLAGQPLACDTQTRLDLVHDHLRAGLQLHNMKRRAGMTRSRFEMTHLRAGEMPARTPRQRLRVDRPTGHQPLAFSMR